MKKPLLLAAVIIAIVILGVSLTRSGERLVVSTTTSLYDTGLLEALGQAYEEKTGIRVAFIAQGSGQALETAARGDACAVIAHAPRLEREYIEQGAISHHVIIAYNYFVIVGPPGDPAGVSQAESAVDAFRRIYQAGEEGRALFVSRGDRSGTHVREMELWKLAGLDPRGRPWYIETGQGMANTLVIAGEKGAYTLSDIGTYLKVRPEGLAILYTNSSELINIYSAYVSTACASNKAAVDFVEWLASGEAQEIIGSYGVEEYGRPLFYPARGMEDWLWREWSRLAGG